MKQTLPSGDAWRADRKWSLGGSDAAAILGMSKWRGPLSTYVDKTTPYKPETEPAPILFRVGHALEPMMIELLQERGYKARAERPYTITRHKLYPYLHATLDGRVTKDGRRGIIELKTAQHSKAAEWAEGVPPYYYAQCQHNMIVASASWAICACTIGNTDFVVHEVEKSREMAEEWSRFADWWWRYHVIGKREPAPTGADLGTLDDLHAVGSPTTAVMGQDSVVISQRYDELVAEIAELEKEKKDIRATIRAEMKADEVLEHPLAGAWTCRSGPSGKRILRRKK